MFATASVARRIERAEAGLIAEGARAAARRLPAGQLMIREMQGGVAAFVEPGAPFNKVAGLGFDGVPPPEVLDALEREFAERQAPLRFEVATLANPEVVRTLTRRGYELVGFENVLGLALGAASGFEAVPDIQVTRVADDEAPAWLDVVATAFMHPDAFDGPASDESFPRDLLDRVFGDTIAAPTFERYLARRGGSLAGGASFRVQDGVAQLNGAATLPEHRRHGVQTALLRHRLGEAARRGCDIAVVTTEPGSKSQENVQKAGFSLLYARAVLICARTET
ncbi:MAG TPA: GNAT family N-acetyltransferase [Vicinamibacterales bacterium]|nr:GNAT family N-acetyltransferase [Vicinamibacterales bacterium]